MDAAKPLAGLKVLELARILAGPWAGQTLADLELVLQGKSDTFPHFLFVPRDFSSDSL